MEGAAYVGASLCRRVVRRYFVGLALVAVISFLVVVASVRCWHQWWAVVPHRHRVVGRCGWMAVQYARVGVFPFSFGLVVLGLVGCGALGKATEVVRRADVGCPWHRPQVVRIPVAVILLALWPLRLGMFGACLGMSSSHHVARRHFVGLALVAVLSFPFVARHLHQLGLVGLCPAVLCCSWVTVWCARVGVALCLFGSMALSQVDHVARRHCVGLVLVAVLSFPFVVRHLHQLGLVGLCPAVLRCSWATVWRARVGVALYLFGSMALSLVEHDVAVGALAVFARVVVGCSRCQPWVVGCHRWCGLWVVAVTLVVVALYVWAAAVARLGVHRFVFCAGYGPSLMALFARGCVCPRLVVQLRRVSWDAARRVLAWVVHHRLLGAPCRLVVLFAVGCAFHSLAVQRCLTLPRLVVQLRRVSWDAAQRVLAWVVHHRLLGAHCRLVVLFAVGCAFHSLAVQRCLMLRAAMWGLLVPFAGGVRRRVVPLVVWLVMMGGLWWA